MTISSWIQVKNVHNYKIILNFIKNILVLRNFFSAYFYGIPSLSKESMLYSLKMSGRPEDRIEILTDPSMIKMIQQGKNNI